MHGKLVSKERNTLSLPAIGAEVFTYLKDINDRESFIASRRLKDLLTSCVRTKLQESLGEKNYLEPNNSLYRKIVNSLLSAGTSGYNRTRDALLELQFSKNDFSQEINFNELAEALREWSKDFRSAKGFLDHNFKCINSFLRIQSTPNDETVRDLLRLSITDYQVFDSWSLRLINYWQAKGIVNSPLKSTYLATFQSFLATFEQDLSNFRFGEQLNASWSEYIPEKLKKDDYIGAGEPTMITSLNLVERRKNFDVSLEVFEGVISYAIDCGNVSELQASELRLKLAMALSKNDEFLNLRFRVWLEMGKHPVIKVTVENLEVGVEVSRIVEFLESTWKGVQFQH